MAATMGSPVSGSSHAHCPEWVALQEPPLPLAVHGEVESAEDEPEVIEVGAQGPGDAGRWLHHGVGEPRVVGAPVQQGRVDADAEHLITDDGHAYVAGLVDPLLKKVRGAGHRIVDFLSGDLLHLHRAGDAVDPEQRGGQRLVDHGPVSLDERASGVRVGGDRCGRQPESAGGCGGEAGGLELGVADAVGVVDVQAAGQRGHDPADAEAGLRDGEPRGLVVEMGEGER